MYINFSNQITNLFILNKGGRRWQNFLKQIKSLTVMDWTNSRLTSPIGSCFIFFLSIPPRDSLSGKKDAFPPTKSF